MAEGVGRGGVVQLVWRDRYSSFKEPAIDFPLINGMRSDAAGVLPLEEGRA